MADADNQQEANSELLDIEEFAGAILTGMELLKNTDLSLKEFQAKFEQALETQSGAFENLNRAEQLEALWLSRPRSLEDQQALEAGFEQTIMQTALKRQLVSDST